MDTLCLADSFFCQELQDALGHRQANAWLKRTLAKTTTRSSESTRHATDLVLPFRSKSGQCRSALHPNPPPVTRYCRQNRTHFKHQRTGNIQTSLCQNTHASISSLYYTLATVAFARDTVASHTTHTITHLDVPNLEFQE
jgi:hypothetical protein